MVPFSVAEFVHGSLFFALAALWKFTGAPRLLNCQPSREIPEIPYTYGPTEAAASTRSLVNLRIRSATLTGLACCWLGELAMGFLDDLDQFCGYSLSGDSPYRFTQFWVRRGNGRAVVIVCTDN